MTTGDFNSLRDLSHAGVVGGGITGAVKEAISSLDKRFRTTTGDSPFGVVERVSASGSVSIVSGSTVSGEVATREDVVFIPVSVITALGSISASVGATTAWKFMLRFRAAFDV